MLLASNASKIRELASPVTFAALAAELTLASSAVKAPEGIYLEINSLAAKVNCAASVAWRFSCAAAKAVVLRRATVKMEESIMIRESILYGRKV